MGGETSCVSPRPQDSAMALLVAFDWKRKEFRMHSWIDEVVGRGMNERKLYAPLFDGQLGASRQLYSHDWMCQCWSETIGNIGTVSDCPMLQLL